MWRLLSSDLTATLQSASHTGEVPSAGCGLFELWKTDKPAVVPWESKSIVYIIYCFSFFTWSLNVRFLYRTHSQTPNRVQSAMSTPPKRVHS